MSKKVELLPSNTLVIINYIEPSTLLKSTTVDSKFKRLNQSRAKYFNPEVIKLIAYSFIEKTADPCYPYSYKVYYLDGEPAFYPDAEETFDDIRKSYSNITLSEECT